MDEVNTFSEIEIRYVNAGLHLAGIDEAGRGPLAGPVVAAAVVYSPGTVIDGIIDSKRISSAKREELAVRIKESALAFAIASSSPEEIDSINILQASRLAMKRAVEQLDIKPDICLVDGWPLPGWEQRHRGIVKGDSKCFTIAAGSILAKTARDKIMIDLDKEYPEYGFARHKGYPTVMHREAIKKFGPTPHHRKSFKLLPDSVISATGGYRVHGRRLGIEAEEAAVNYLRNQGFRIVERNFRGDGCELDILAEEGNIFVVVEVKASNSEIVPESQITEKKIRHIARATDAYLTEHSIDAEGLRFDVIAMRYVKSMWKINHIRDAFRP